MTEDEVRRIVREEIASLCGLVLRRTQDETLTRSNERNMADEATRGFIAHVFGEALEDFSR